MEALLPIESKGFEVKAFKQWLAQTTKDAAYAGCLLTADALHTHTTICRAIRRTAPTISLLSNATSAASARTSTISSARRRTSGSLSARPAKSTPVTGVLRCVRCRASDELNADLADRWPEVAQVFQIERTVTRRSRQGTKTTVERIYGLTSVPGQPCLTRATACLGACPLGD